LLEPCAVKVASTVLRGERVKPLLPADFQILETAGGLYFSVAGDWRFQIFWFMFFDS